MENLGLLLQFILDGMKKTVFIYGFETSLWEIFLFTAVGTMVCCFIGGIIHGD